MKRKGPALSEKEVQEFENGIGYKLPKAYRNFLLENNGGKPDKDFFYVPGWQYKQSLITEFESIFSNGNGFGLLQILDVKSDIFPKGFIPIGSDPGGNLILMSLNTDIYGKIFFWDHEDAPDDQLETIEAYTNIYFLANSFEEFVNSLKYEDEL